MSLNGSLDSTQTPTEQPLQSKCDALSPENLSQNMQEFMSLLSDDDADNARDDENAVALSADDDIEPAVGGSRDRGTSAITNLEVTREALPEKVAVLEKSPAEMSGSPPASPCAIPANNNPNATPGYNVLQYSYANRYPPAMADFSTALNSKTNTGKRCYRLNLESPFDIHCEQSPLVS